MTKELKVKCSFLTKEIEHETSAIDDEISKLSTVNGCCGFYFGKIQFSYRNYY